jgi:hypothetical protein
LSRGLPSEKLQENKSISPALMNASFFIKAESLHSLPQWCQPRLNQVSEYRTSESYTKKTPQTLCPKLAMVAPFAGPVPHG